ncbi:fasciclin-like arabinogalactan protein 14 [Dioscorea cayenensis subsp. rotundata]|uniref:Fasciclin-like arabinogalactan protein 14 n=1 Tax=Dioscorea cayennensis subsp. rotundata TaxID=55577 RepID=A0AB40AL99_DIOCR|nr:fasciclin-like arabinogalactan protein 14 [Dioscorea cayenensis subsp. rotundata]
MGLEVKITLLPLLLLIATISSTTSATFNITEILSKYPDFSSFNDLLSVTGVADQINSRQSITILAVDDSGIDAVSGRPVDVVKRILSVHVILDYFDAAKLEKLSGKTTILTTLFQSSGIAANKAGFLNVTDMEDELVSFGSAVPGAGIGANLVKEVFTKPYDLSILQVSDIIVPPGIENLQSSSPTNSPATPPPNSATTTTTTTTTTASPPTNAPSSKIGTTTTTTAPPPTNAPPPKTATTTTTTASAAASPPANAPPPKTGTTTTTAAPTKSSSPAAAPTKSTSGTPSSKSAPAPTKTSPAPAKSAAAPTTTTSPAPSSGDSTALTPSSNTAASPTSEATSPTTTDIAGGPTFEASSPGPATDNSGAARMVAGASLAVAMTFFAAF